MFLTIVRPSGSHFGSSSNRRLQAFSGTLETFSAKYGEQISDELEGLHVSR